MSIPEPTEPHGDKGGAPLASRFLKIFRWLALFSLAVSGLAVAAVMRGEPEFKIHLAIATALGAGLSVLVGGVLMTLMFLSARHGHDSAAADPFENEDER